MKKWSPPPPDEEGFVSWSPKARPEIKVETYYRLNGKLGSKPPIICVHGGPGAQHQYMLPYTQLVESGVPVILYDQIGCGQTTRLVGEEYNDLWVEQTFLEEMEAIYKHLKVEKVTWVGHSWGGYINQHYALLHPSQVHALIVWSGCQDMHECAKSIRSRIPELPKEIQEVIYKVEKEGKYDSEEYQNAVGAFFSLFVVDMEAAESWVQESLQALMSDQHVYSVVQGPSEFTMSGTMKDLTLLPDIHKIACPVLLIDGVDDEMHAHIAACAARLTGSESVWRHSIKGGKHLIYGQSADEHIDVVKRFMAGI